MVISRYGFIEVYLYFLSVLRSARHYFILMGTTIPNDLRCLHFGILSNISGDSWGGNAIAEGGRRLGLTGS